MLLNNISFTVGNYQENILAIESLCKTWHKERKYVKTFEVQYNPDREYFNLCNRSGNLITVCIFDGDVLVGAYLGYKDTSMQDKSITLAHCLMWCIAKEYRCSELLVKFLKYLEDTMLMNNIMQYSLSVDADTNIKLEKYLVHESNPRPFAKIESYFYRDLREISNGSSS